MALKTPENMVWRVAREIEPASYAQLSAAVEQEAVEQQITPFWVWHATMRLVRHGRLYLTADGYRTRTAEEARSHAAPGRA